MRTDIHKKYTSNVETFIEYGFRIYVSSDTELFSINFIDIQYDIFLNASHSPLHTLLFYMLYYNCLTYLFNTLTAK